MFPVLKRIRIRQWAPLFTLMSGLAGSAFGQLVGQSHSWLWFAGGILVAAIVVTVAYVRRARRS